MALLPIFVERWTITPTLRKWLGNVMDYDRSSTVLCLNRDRYNLNGWSGPEAGPSAPVTLAKGLLGFAGRDSDVQR